MNKKKRANDLTGKEWLQHSFSIWRNLKKTKEEWKIGHPASYPVALCEKLIKTFTIKNSNILDPFNGIGSTMMAAHNLNCKGLGIDLSEDYCNIAKERIDNEEISIINGNSLVELKKIKHNTFDLCVTSPPYWDILNMKRSADGKKNISYDEKNNNLGNLADYDFFLTSLQTTFTEVYRVLKERRYCIVNVMDIRKKSVFYPLHSDFANCMQKIGFIYDDLIIWDRQSDYNNMRPLGYPYKFRINKVHEYLLIFYKE